MILDNIDNCGLYYFHNPLVRRGIEFLASNTFPAPGDGRIEIDGDRLYAVVAVSRGKLRADAQLESHRKYIDIQYVISGADRIGWRSAKTCVKPVRLYDATLDIEFFADEPTGWFNVGQGCFAVFFPDDAHAPLVECGDVRKVVVKVLNLPPV